MKKQIMKQFIVFVAAMIVLSCGSDPVTRSSTNNPDVQVSLLFEHEGIKVYRFVDAGHYVYYTNACGVTRYNTGGKNPVETEAHSNGE